MEQDRRNYFRIDDEISLVYQVIPESAAIPNEDELEAYYDFRFSLLSHLNELDSRVESKLNEIRKNDPNVAEYLKTINQKFELLAKLMIFQDTPPEQHTQQVNLSAGGLAFKAHESIDKGAMLEIKFVLYPSLIGVMVFGRVVNCRENDEDDAGKYIVAIEFESIKESDREMIIRHILNKQVEQIRELRKKQGIEKNLNNELEL